MIREDLTVTWPATAVASIVGVTLDTPVVGVKLARTNTLVLFAGIEHDPTGPIRTTLYAVVALVFVARTS